MIKIVENPFLHRKEEHTHCLIKEDIIILAGDLEQCRRVRDFVNELDRRHARNMQEA